MTDYNTMTAQQCADWLAERDGWKHVLRHTHASGLGQYWWVNNDGRELLEHPFELTLDAAAAALREPWRLVQVDIWPGNVVARIVRDHCGSRKCVVGPDRLTAEYRAAVAARMEDEPNRCSIIECLDKVREAGGKAWDNVANPDAVLRGEEDAKEAGK